MSRPVPLMFVSGPPVYTRVSAEGEESTSIFVIEKEMSEVAEPLAKQPIESKEVESSILAKVARLQSPIGQRVYQELTFVFDDEEVIGNAGKLEGHTLIIEVNGDEDEIIAVELADLREIIWRGKPLPEN